MPLALYVALALALVAIAAWWLSRWRTRNRDESAWRDSMAGLTEYCQKFAATHGLQCEAGVDQWPFGWPRLHGQVEGAALALAFGWQKKDIWVASMRMRAAGRMGGDFHVVRAYTVADATRLRTVRLGDTEFDENYLVTSSHGEIDPRRAITARARRALLAIPGAELGYRDGVAVLSWPCEAFLRGGTEAESEYTTIDCAFEVLEELARVSIVNQRAR